MKHIDPVTFANTALWNKKTGVNIKTAFYTEIENEKQTSRRQNSMIFFI